MPSAIALSLLVFMAAVGYGVKPASAALELSTACGPELMSEDETELFLVVVSQGGGHVAVNLSDESGDSDITSATLRGEYRDLDNPTDFIDQVELIVVEADDGSGDLSEEFEDLLDDIEDAGFFIDFFDCFDEDQLEEFEDFAREGLLDCIDDNSLCATGDWTNDDLTLTPGEIIDIIVDEILSGTLACNDLGNAVEDALLLGGTPAGLAATIDQDIVDLCIDDTFLLIDGVAVVDVTCQDPGEFDLSFSIEEVPFEGKTHQFEVQCVGEVDEGLITATPDKVEIVPAKGSVSYSLITVSLLDDDGEPAEESVTVDFSTDRCEFLDEDGIGDLETLEEALEVFADYDPNDPDSAKDVHDFVEANIEDDPDDVSNDVSSFTLDDDFGDFDEDDTLAAIVLDCSDEDFEPGIAEVCFQIDQEGADVMGCVEVTVVGPPAIVTAAAAPSSLICGEKATITVTVKDAAGQNVSDHTRVEAVTNLGGVLAGTGAVAGQAGLVVPVSSTVGETFNGIATMYLLTSDAHAGPYEVVIATGGSGSVNDSLGGVFSTPPQVVQATVTCAQPTTVAPAAPTVSAPDTGTGTVRPPSTGEAGLAAVSQDAGFSWALLAVAGVMAFSVAGLATLKISRR